MAELAITKDFPPGYFGPDPDGMQAPAADSEEDFQSLCETAPDAKNQADSEETKPEELPFANMVSMADITGKRAKWLVTGWIPKNAISFIFADGGSGKTSVWCSLIADLSAGRQTMLEAMPGSWKPKKCMLLSSEDDAESVIQPKLKENKANMQNIIILPLDSEDLHEMKFSSKIFEGTIKHFRPDVILIDPIQSFIGDVNMSARNECRDSLNYLVQYGKRYEVTTVIMSHTNKKDTSGRNKMSDSSDFWDIARSIMFIGKSGNLRFIAHEKCNYGKLQDTVLFEIGGDNGIPIRRGTTPKSAAELSAQRTETSISKKEECKEVIYSYLQKNGPCLVSELDEYMKVIGYADSTVRDSKSELNNAGVTITARGKKEDGFKYSVRLNDENLDGPPRE